MSIPKIPIYLYIIKFVDDKLNGIEDDELNITDQIHQTLSETIYTVTKIYLYK